MKHNVINLLKEYKSSLLISHYEQEYIEKFLEFINKEPGCFDRQPGGHITASAWIVSPHSNAVLLTHHKKLNKWLQLGGHCDGDSDVYQSALREAREESGIQDFSLIISGIFDIDIHPLANACEYHFDIRFLLKAHQSEFLISDESHDLAWVPFDDISRYTCEESVLRMNKKYQNLHS